MSIKVLIVDDSALIRQILTEIVNAQPDMRVVGVAGDPLIARDRIKALNPDVITLDVEMPRMDGLAFLEKLMQLRPMPVLMISSLTERGAQTTLRALELGAVDFVTKPKLDISNGMQAYANVIAEKIRIAAKAQVRSFKPSGPRAGDLLPRLASPRVTKDRVIAVGASTGGTEAIRTFLTQLPADAPTILITQHMPEGFTRAFADRLNGLCEITVKEAEQGELVQPGCAYIAPGHSHLSIVSAGRFYRIQLDQNPPVNRHRPAVDVLFHSVAKVAGKNAVGVLMTGMGADGARGLLAMKQAGALTIAQDEASCVVFGMPKVAIDLGAAERILPLTQIAQTLLTELADTDRASGRANAGAP